MNQPEKITSAHLPEELFEAGHKLMVERAELQRMEEAKWHFYREGFRYGLFLGVCGAALLACVIFFLVMVN